MVEVVVADEEVEVADMAVAAEEEEVEDGNLLK